MTCLIATWTSLVSSSGEGLRGATSQHFRRRRSGKWVCALFLAQMGERHARMAKTLKGFGESNDCNTYRAVYTVRYADVVYVLHAFQKKSTRGVATPRSAIELIRKRLNDLMRERSDRDT